MGPDEPSRHHRVVREAVDPLAPEAHRARARGERAHETGKEGRLARPVRTEDPEDLAPGHIEVDAFEGEETVETLRQAADRKDRLSGHSPPSPAGAGRAAADPKGREGPWARKA